MKTSNVRQYWVELRRKGFHSCSWITCVIAFWRGKKTHSHRLTYHVTEIREFILSFLWKYNNYSTTRNDDDPC